MITWKVGEVVARFDAKLVIDACEPDTGEYFVKVGIWNGETASYICFRYVLACKAKTSDCSDALHGCLMA